MSNTKLTLYFIVETPTQNSTGVGCAYLTPTQRNSASTFRSPHWTYISSSSQFCKDVIVSGHYFRDHYISFFSPFLWYPGQFIGFKTSFNTSTLSKRPSLYLFDSLLIMHHRHALCIMHYSSCIMHHSPCIMHHATSKQGRRPKFGMLTVLTNLRSTKVLWAMPHSDFLAWLSSATLKNFISGVSTRILML